MSITIAPLQRRAVSDAARLLTDVFLTSDPVFADLWPDLDVRQRAFRGFFRIPLIDGHRCGEVDVALDGSTMVGVAVWLPPGAYPMSPWRQLLVAPSMLRVVAAAPRSAGRLGRLGEAVDAHFGERHVHYLQVLGVATDRQGQGVGSALLRHGLERVDRIGAEAYLETNSSSNVPLYKRHGFVIEDAAAALLADGPTTWLMTRPAAGRSTAT